MTCKSFNEIPAMSTPTIDTPVQELTAQVVPSVSRFTVFKTKAKSWASKRNIGILVVMYCFMFAYNYTRTEMPSVLPSYRATQFDGNGFVGGTALRVSYPFRTITVFSVTNAFGINEYYYKMGDNMFKYNRDSKTWNQIHV